MGKNQEVKKYIVLNRLGAFGWHARFFRTLKDAETYAESESKSNGRANLIATLKGCCYGDNSEVKKAEENRKVNWVPSLYELPWSEL